MKVFFSSDYHLGHKNVIKYDGRPFNSIEEMDSTIISNHNSVVGKDDHFYFLGDISLNSSKTDYYLSQLNGIKFFLKGNHDHSHTTKLYRKYGEYLGYMHEVKIGSFLIVICHYALRVWNKSHRGSWHLYGHSHHTLPDDIHSRSLDVGINGPDYGYKPLSFDQIGLIMARKDYKPVDHHVDRD